MLKQLLEKNEIPFDRYYIIDYEKLQNNIISLKGSFSKYFDLTLAYSYKTNYIPAVLKIIHENEIYAEIVSDFEFDIAINVMKENKIIYNGPIKSEHVMRRFDSKNKIINIENENDFSIVRKLDLNCKYAIRCDLSSEDDKLNTRFGIAPNSRLFDEVKSWLAARGRYGLHVHTASRDLNTFKIKLEKIYDLVLDSNLHLDHLNLGGGLMSDLSDEWLQALDVQRVTFDDYAYTCHEILQGVQAQIGTLILEPGTALVANTMDYVATITDVKKRKTGNIAVMTGSTFDFAGTKRRVSLPVEVIEKSGNEAYNVERIAGYTCIENDEITHHGLLAVGDKICIKNQGSYSFNMKPNFIHYAAPILLKREGNLFLVAKEEDSQAWLQRFLA